MFQISIHIDNSNDKKVNIPNLNELFSINNVQVRNFSNIVMNFLHFGSIGYGKNLKNYQIVLVKNN